MRNPTLRGPKRPQPHRITVDEAALKRFVTQSNAIERIFREPTKDEIEVTRDFIGAEVITVDSMRQLVSVYQPNAEIRDRHGMNVRVGEHVAPPGGPQIVTDLRDLLVQVQSRKLSPFEAYMRYEDLHPFIDGNGRSGRALWAWRLVRSEYAAWFDLGFLNAFHYQAFPAWRMWGKKRK